MDAIQKHSLYSTLRENIVEHLFAGEILRILWRRGIVDAEILKSEFDAGGYDLVLTCRNVTRHIQLKVSRVHGARADVSVNLRLAEKPSGCVVWIRVDDDLEFKDFLWFGGNAGEPLPSIDHMKVAKHTRGNSEGMKSERPKHRLISRSAFISLKTFEGLIFKLLGNDIMSAVNSNIYVTAAHSADFLSDENGLSI